MLNVCKNSFLVLILCLQAVSLAADASVTSIEQLEEKMENVTFCSDRNKENCNHFNCLETCLNLSEDPIDCSETCYLEVDNRKLLTYPLVSRR